MSTPLRSRAISLDAPIDGWNAFDSMDNMPPTAAVVLDNMIPAAGTVNTRKGRIEFGDTLTGQPVETVASLDTSSESKLIVASGGGVWEMNDSPAQVGSQVINEIAPEGTFGLSRWQTSNFRSADEEGVLIMCNGQDDTQFLKTPYTSLTPMQPTDGTLPFTWKWTRIADSNSTLPAAGQWNMDTLNETLRINWIDNTLTENRQMDLRMGERSVIRLEDDLIADNWIEVEVTGDYTEFGDYTEYPIVVTDSGLGTPTVGEVQAVTGQGGVLEADFIGVCLYKGRAYYWYDEDDSLYYAQAGAYTGELQRFPLGAIAQKGGKIVLVDTWTQQDSGDGKDDFLVVVFSTGEILLYQGDDPETIGFFEMVGRYLTAEPLSIRGSAQYGSDLILMTKDGYIALSTLVQQGRISDVPAFSRLIHSAIVQRTLGRSSLFGWDCRLFPKQGLFVFNVPLSETTFEQHVMNTVTQRWCRFTDLNVNCLEVHNERLFGGTHDGRVLALLETTADEGAPIEFTALPAFNYLGDAGNHKFITAAQIISTHQQPWNISITGFADFRWSVPKIPFIPVDREIGIWSINPPLPPAELGSFWDEDYWGVGDAPFTTEGWQNVSAFGYAVSILVQFKKLDESVEWRSTGLRYHQAGAQ